MLSTALRAPWNEHKIRGIAADFVLVRSLEILSLSNDRQVDRLALQRWGDAEVIHRQAFGGTPIDADAAADAGSLVNHHRRSKRSELSAS